MVFSVVFQASKGKKLRGEQNHGKNPGTRKFDAKHSANVLTLVEPQRILVTREYSKRFSLQSIHFL